MTINDFLKCKQNFTYFYKNAVDNNCIFYYIILCKKKKR